MSSAEDDLNVDNLASGVALGSKKRNVQRACDVCRRKKVRCDGRQMEGNKCSNCISCNYECRYVEAAKKRGPSKGYVAGLENRLEKMEKLLSKLAPGGDFSQELGDGSIWLQTGDSVHQKESTASVGSSSHLRPRVVFKEAALEDDRVVPRDSDNDDEEVVECAFAEDFRRKLQIDPIHSKLFGKSSGATLVQTAISLKREYTGTEVQPKRSLIPSRRPEFWTRRPWETVNDKNFLIYEFPDNDLMVELIDLYFNHANIFIPVLHRPTLEREIADGLHLRDTSFGGVVLLVCAIASRYSNDHRVFLSNTGSALSAGWKWFEQIHMIKKSVLTPPCLHDLQIHSLYVIFLQGTGLAQACWTMAGIGIRLAQEVGCHRRKMYASTLTVEDELWKRAFWTLVFFDRIYSCNVGRPCSTQDEDFDIDFPVDCDDEYWENLDPEKAFKQPPNKPSKVSFFISYLKLNQVLAFALRTVYATNKAKVLLGFRGHEWDRHIVAELDSALNKWTDNVPDHLRWDPSREDGIFLHQSACLYTSYYHLQILIHRPYISFHRKPSPLSFPSLAICTNAARSCIHVVDIQQKMGLPLPHMHISLFTAGVVLLVNILGGKQSGLSTNANKDMEDVHKCMVILKVCEQRWHQAGRLWDVLYDLASTRGLPLPNSGLAFYNKRERNSDSPKTADSVTASSTSTPSPAGRIQDSRGLQRVSAEKNFSPVPDLAIEHYSSSLPMHDDELQRPHMHGHSSTGSDRTIDTSNHFWLSMPGSSTIPGQSLAANPTEDYSGLDTMALPDNLFYNQMGNEQGQSYGSYPLSGPGSNQEQFQNPQATIDIDTVTVWNNVPTGFQLDDWNSYMNELNFGQYRDSYGPGPGPGHQA